MDIFDVLDYGNIVFWDGDSHILVTWNGYHTFNVWTQGSNGGGDPIDAWTNTDCFTSSEDIDNEIHAGRVVHGWWNA